MKINSIRLLVESFDDMFRFYRDVLGLDVTFGTEGDVYAQFRASAGSEIGLFQRSLMDEAIGRSAIREVGATADGFVLIVEVDNVDETVARLRERQVSLVIEPTDRESWGIRTAHLRDPEGNLIEIMSGLKQ